MNDWFSLPLGDALTAQVTLGTIRNALTSSAAGAGAAVFMRQVSGPLHCEVTVYFSPAAAALARQFDATPCAAPGRRGLELLAGQAGGASRLFDGFR
jgi:hypothetical protein